MTTKLPDNQALVPTEPLVRPSLRWLVELHLEGSFPLHLTDDPLTTARLGAGPELVSTVDIAPSVLPPGLNWDEQIGNENPVLWYRLTEPPNASNAVNSGSIGGVASLDPAASEQDVDSPVLSSTQAKLYSIASVNMARRHFAIVTMKKTWADEVAADTPQYWYRLDEPGAPLKFANSGSIASPGDLTRSLTNFGDIATSPATADGASARAYPTLGQASVSGASLGWNVLTVSCWLKGFPLSFTSQVWAVSAVANTPTIHQAGILIVSATQIAAVWSGAGGVFSVTMTPPTDGDWHYYVATFSNVAGTVTINAYMDGVLIGTLSNARAAYGVMTYTIAINGQDGLQIDEAVLYDNKVLSPARIAAQYAARRNLAKFTMLCWMKVDQDALNTDIFYQTFADGGFAGILVDSVGMLQARFGSSSSDWVSSDVFIADGFWHMVALVLDRTPVKTELIVSMYVDGVVAASRTWNVGSNIPPSAFGGHVLWGPDDVAMDELVIIQDVLTGDEIAQLYLAGLRASSLKPAIVTPMAAILSDSPRAWYRMNAEPTDKAFADVHLMTALRDWVTEVSLAVPSFWWRLGDPAGATSFYDSGAKGINLPITVPLGDIPAEGALLYDTDGGRSYPSLSGTAAKTGVSGLLFTEKVTIAFWVNGKGNTLSANYQLFVLTSAGKYVEVFCRIPSVIGIRINDGVSGGSLKVEASNPLDGDWHFIAFTMENLGTQVRLNAYVDGELAGTTTANYVKWTVTTTDITLQGASGIKLDEWMVWDNQVLDQQVFQRMYLAGRGTGRPMIPTVYGPIGGSQVPGALKGDDDLAYAVYRTVQSREDIAAQDGGMFQIRDGVTIEAWVRKDTAPIVVTQIFAQAVGPWVILEIGTTGVRGVLGSVVTSIVNVHDGEWHHVAVSLRPSFPGWWQQVQTDSPVLLYSLDDGATPTAFSNSGVTSALNKLTRTITGDVQDVGSTPNEQTNFGRRYPSAGVAENLSITGVDLTAGCTMLVWMKIPTTLGAIGDGPLIGQTASVRTVKFRYGSGRNVAVDLIDTTHPTITGTFTLPDGNWHFLAVTGSISGANVTVKRYLDGKLISTSTGPYSAGGTWNKVQLRGVTGVWLDEFAIFDHEMSADRIATYALSAAAGSYREVLELSVDGVLANSAVFDPGLGDSLASGVQYTIQSGSVGTWLEEVTTEAPELWYRLDEPGTAATFVNAGSILGDAISRGGSTMDDVREIGGGVIAVGNACRRYPGALGNSFASNLAATGLTTRLISGNGCTLMAWIQMPNNLTVNSPFFELNTLTSPVTHVGLWMLMNNQWVGVLRDNVNPQIAPVNTLPADGDWHHIAMTVSMTGTTATIRVFRDGVFQTSTGGTGTFVASSEVFTKITVRGWGGAAVDEPLYWDRIVSDARILALYQAGANERAVELDEVAFFSPVLAQERLAAHARAGRWLTERLYKGKLRTGTQLQFSTPTETGGVVQAQQATLSLPNTDGYWNQWYEKEVRGKLVHIHLLDENTQEIQEYLFTGEITVWSYSLEDVSVTLESISAQKFLSAVPGIAVTKDVSDIAAGIPVILGMGAGDFLPCLPVKVRKTFTDEEEWDYIVGRGNLGISEMTSGPIGLPFTDRTKWTYLPRTYRLGGIYCTSLRFGAPWDGTTIAVSAQRAYPDWDDYVMYEWKWLMDFLDDVHQLISATPAGWSNPLTTIALTTGPTEIGLGGINLTAQDGDFLETDKAVSIPSDPFTVEMWVKINATGHVGTVPALLVGPNATPTQTPWKISYEVATKKVIWNQVDSGTPTTIGSVVIENGVWTQLVFARSKLADGTFRLKIYKNGKLDSVNIALAVTYSTTSFGFRLFDFPGNARANKLSGVFGWCRVSVTERDAKYVQEAYWRMRRNFIVLLREIIETDIGDFVDDQSFENAAEIVNDIPTPDAGLLCCDGYMTQQVDGLTAITALSRLRDFRLFRNRTGGIAIEVAQPGAVRQLTLSAGPPENNIISIDRLVRFSLSEAVRSMPIYYHQGRQTNGTAAGYAVRTATDAEILPVGRIGDPYELPFVYSHRTADIVRDWVSKRLALRDTAIQVTADHVARFLRPGHIVHLRLPNLVNFESDAEVVNTAMQGHQNTLTLVKYDEAPFVYVPDPDIQKDTPLFDVVLPATQPILMPVGTPDQPFAGPWISLTNGTAFKWNILIGEPQERIQALYQTSIDYAANWRSVGGLASYTADIFDYNDPAYMETRVQTPNLFRFLCSSPIGPKKYVPNVAAVGIEVGVESVTSSAFWGFGAGSNLAVILRNGIGGAVDVDGIWINPFPAVGPFAKMKLQAVTNIVPAIAGAPQVLYDWNSARALVFGVRASNGVQIRVHSIKKIIYPQIKGHPYYGFSRIWRSKSPVFPPSTDVPFFTTTRVDGPAGSGGLYDDGGVFADAGEFDSTGVWYYFLRVYDILNREVGSCGPVPVFVT